MSNNNLADSAKQFQIELQRYENALTTYFMSKATRENEELLSISSAPGMGQIATFTQTLLNVNAKINKANLSFDSEDKKNALSPLSFETLRASPDVFTTLEKKIQAEPSKIFFVESCDILNEESRKALVNLAKENKANVVFGSLVLIDSTHQFSVSTDMNQFIEQGKLAKSWGVQDAMEETNRVGPPTQIATEDKNNFETNYMIQTGSVFSKIRKSREANGISDTPSTENNTNQNKSKM